MSSVSPSIARAIPVRLNAALVAACVALNVWQLWVLPVWFLPRSPWWALTLIPGVLLTNGYWALLHEGIHRNLHPHRAVNDALARLAFVLFGAPYAVIATAHLLHHRHSRTSREYVELYDPDKVAPGAARFDYYFNLLGGLYLMEVASLFVMLLPRRLARAAADRLDQPGRLTGDVLRYVVSSSRFPGARRDAWAILIAWGAAFALYGAQAWILALALYGRAVLISVGDYIYHYDTPTGDPKHGLNAAAPRWLHAMLLNFNCHGVHHQHPAMPWPMLARYVPACGGYGPSWFLLMARQFAGPRWLRPRPYPRSLPPVPAPTRISHPQ